MSFVSSVLDELRDVERAVSYFTDGSNLLPLSSNAPTGNDPNTVYRNWYTNYSSNINGHNIEIRAELPGVSKENVDLSISNSGRQLSISSERCQNIADDTGKLTRVCDVFNRAFRLPGIANPASVNASMKNGLLVVDVPFGAADPQQQKIPIN